MPGFSEKLDLKKQTHSLFCVGLDPSKENLSNWSLPQTAKGSQEFCNRVFDAALNEISIFKPQYAFFEQFGLKGLEVLSDIMKLIRDSGALCILDCKKGDIGSTMAAYGEAAFSAQSDFKADAITVTPYLGFQALKPVFSKAHSSGATVFVVVRSSNPEGQKIQTARLKEGFSVSEALARQIQLENSKVWKQKTIGAVIGATLDPEDQNNRRLISHLTDSWILAPGIGAQGASIPSLKTLFGSQVKNVIPSASRSLYAEGRKQNTLKKVIKKYKEETLKLLG